MKQFFHRIYSGHFNERSSNSQKKNANPVRIPGKTNIFEFGKKCELIEFSGIDTQCGPIPFFSVYLISYFRVFSIFGRWNVINSMFFSAATATNLRIQW